MKNISTVEYKARYAQSLIARNIVHLFDDTYYNASTMKKNVVVIGGGTGTFTVLTGLKRIEDLDLTAVVAVTDSGGSSGRLRDEYGILPVGDIRQALVSLADAENGDTLLRKLFLYRFDRGELDGHNFGNLFLTAMTDILGSEDKAIRYASQVLKIRGNVIPITTKDTDLVAEYEDGSVLVGEASIDEPSRKHDCTKRITSLRVQPRAQISKEAKESILSADFVILGPGDLYSSLLSNFAIHGTTSALKKSEATFIYIVNIMSKYGQTHGMTAADHVEETKKYAGKYPDVVIMHNNPIPEPILDRYQSENAYPVIDDLDSKKYNILRNDIVSLKEVPKVKGDTVTRSIIRHDSDKLSHTLESIMIS